MPKLAGQTLSKMSKSNTVRYCIKHCIELVHKNEKRNFKMTYVMLILVLFLIRLKMHDKSEDETTLSNKNLGVVSVKIFLVKHRNHFKKPHSTYYLMLLLLSNDIELNPGPKSLKKCSVCNNNENTEMIECQTCKRIFHLTCIINSDINCSFEWICPSRRCKPNHQSLPILRNIITSPNRYCRENLNNKNSHEINASTLSRGHLPQTATEMENQELFNELPKIKSKDYIGKDLCKQCYKQVNDNQAAIICDVCDFWSHRFCCNITTKTYNDLKKRGNFPWSCPSCRIGETLIKEKIDINCLSKNCSPEDYETVKQQRNESLILHINCRSLINKREEFENIIQTLKPNIVCLTETWFDGSVSPKDFVPEGYNIIRHDRSEMFKTKYAKKNGGGVAIIYKDHIKIQKISLLTDPVEEILWIRVKTKYNFLLGVLYRPEYTDILKENGEESLLETNIRTATETARNIVLLGDFNINYGNQNDHLTQKLENICSTNGLSQQIVNPTRIDSCTGKQTILDHIWINKEFVPIKSAGTCLGLSDHLATYIKINTQMEREEKTVIYRNFKEYNQEEFCTALQEAIENSEINHSITVEKNVHTAMKLLANAINNTLDCFAPIQERKIISRFNPIPWYNSELKKLLEQKNNLLKDFYQYGLEVLKKPIKMLNNKIVHLKRKLKSNYLTKKLKDAKDNPKEYWKIINSVIGTDSKTEHIEPDMMTQERADNYNQYFANVGQEILKELNLNISPSELKGSEGFAFQPETNESIIKLIDVLKPDVATGRDGISSKIIKDSKVIIAPVLTKIINLGYSTNTFPNSMKEAAIRPIHKKDDSNIISNYRPISILPCLSKIFERSASNQLIKYLEDHNLLSPSQHAYRKMHGTKTCLFQVINYVQELLDNKNLVAIVSLDLSKAFDAINHEMLLEKLKKLGLSESALYWMKSYLSERRQCTKFSTVTSKDEKVTSGVPQGSILGPLLFICFSNDLYEALEDKCKAFSYADDSQLILQSKSKKELKRKIEEIIKLSHSWYSSNCMKANQAKTEILIVNTQNINSKYLKIKVVEKGKVKMLTPSKSIKILGVIIDENLNWKKQILYVKKHATNTIRKLHRINHLLPVDVRIQLYNSLVVPHFDYCDIIWAGCGAESARKLQVSQNFAIRSLTGAKKRDSASKSFEKVKFLKLNQRREIHEVVFAHKSLLHQHPNDICEKYIKQCPTSNTRSSKNAILNYPSHNTHKYETCPFYRTITSWNNIPSHITTNTTTKAFKSEYQRHLIKTTYSQN